MGACTVNGKPHELEPGETVARLLERLGLEGPYALVERNGEPVARLEPVAGSSATSLREGFAAWSLAERDPTFADDLERVNRADQPPDLPWAS